VALEQKVWRHLIQNVQVCLIVGLGCDCSSLIYDTSKSKMAVLCWGCSGMVVLVAGQECHQRFSTLIQESTARSSRRFSSCSRPSGAHRKNNPLPPQSLTSLRKSTWKTWSQLVKNCMEKKPFGKGFSLKISFAAVLALKCTAHDILSTVVSLSNGACVDGSSLQAISRTSA